MMFEEYMESLECGYGEFELTDEQDSHLFGLFQAYDAVSDMSADDLFVLEEDAGVLNTMISEIAYVCKDAVMSRIKRESRRQYTAFAEGNEGNI